MKCPFCSSDNTKVIDSRPADDNTSIRRRRQCEDCGKRFTTYEKLETRIWVMGEISRPVRAMIRSSSSL